MADDPQPASPEKKTLDSKHIGKKTPCSSPMAQKSPKQDMYWFAYAADPPAERQRRGLWAQQVDELASPEQELDSARGSQKESPCSPLDTYWFAHAGGDAPNEDGTERRLSPDRTLGNHDCEAGDAACQQQQQVSREERLRLVKERQEEERARRLQELEQHSQASQHYREQQEVERRRRIEELRVRDHERRQQERKEALLKRNMERECKLEARRNANRMSMSFAFGSSTPRTFDLDLATMGSAGAPVLMSAPSPRKADETDFESSRKRAASAYNLCQAADAAQTDPPCLGVAHSPEVAFISPNVGGWLVGSGVTVGDDPMTRSMTALPSQHGRGRRKTDLMPVIPWNRGTSATSRSRSPTAGGPAPPPAGVAQRAVSMSRLDLLAQPRRRLLPPAPHASPSMNKSMLELAGPPSRRVHGGGVDMSKSMVLLGSGARAAAASSAGAGQGRLRQARSMSQLAVLPRPTRASLLRVTRTGAPAGGKEQQQQQQSPSRPRSSLSVASEHSMASSQMSASVVLRPRAPPRKPRPLSIAGTIPDKALQSRQSRPPDRPAPTLSEKNVRARASGAEQMLPPEVPPKPAHLRKPHKPQPPASSPLRREQRAPVPPARAPKDTKEASPSPAPTAPPIPVALVAPTVPTAVVEPSAPVKKDAAVPATASAIQSDAPVPTATVAPTVAPTAPAVAPVAPAAPVFPAVPTAAAAVPTPEAPVGPVAEPARPAQVAVESVVFKEVTTKPEREPSAEPCPKQPSQVKEGEPSSEARAEEGPAKAPSRVISEEEARALLAEKRRLAREQAEREAELERQRQEELRRQEEERLRLEEEEQRRFEEEQIRLAAEFRRQEEEKLRRAIEEQEKREAEERQRRELEAQQKAEREEQERKAREEAEKQRKELEERLKREEAERAERKKRVEEIMSRTRRRGGKEPGSPASPASRAGDSQGPDSSEENNGLSARPQASPERDRSPSLSGRSSPQASGKQVDGAPEGSQPLPAACSEPAGLEAPAEKPAAAPSTEQQQQRQVSGEEGVLGRSAAGPPETAVNGREQIGEVADSLRGGSQDGSGGAVPMDQSPQERVAASQEVGRTTNGYGSHHDDSHDMVNGVAPGKVADLLGLDSLTSLVPLKPEGANHSVENLRNAGDINSNRIVPANQLIEFEEDNKNNKTQEMQFTDLLS
ncbi:serine/arginine repetitive matrix protein 1 isoform X3 [Ixodes scapularis]|uniref:serine/arginine repetitive matrix protein 1 isoform X3 n=1 Tax=Ixodes scapularis TaxID=6945 RepID=UPI001C390F37|nr:serine/arginine repetitive matrix protein 1 isoform X3 [Ixodes scapularis]